MCSTGAGKMCRLRANKPVARSPPPSHPISRVLIFSASAIHPWRKRKNCLPADEGILLGATAIPLRSFPILRQSGMTNILSVSRFGRDAHIGLPENAPMNRLDISARFRTFTLWKTSGVSVMAIVRLLRKAD